MRELRTNAGGRLDAPALFEDQRLARVLALLNGRGEDTRLVGGAVRNALLGLPPGDIDLATTATPEAVMARAAAARLRAIPTGIAHGTVTLMSGGLPLEVTTLREDVETDGRHAVVRFGRDFARDAERRDFTVNALSAGPDGTLHDTTGGGSDLAAGRIRFIGDPATRIREDYLRILRFFRFHATYGIGPLDALGLAAVAEDRAGVEQLSRERIRAELLKLLAAPGAVSVVEAMDRVGLFAPVLHGPADPARLARLVAAQGADADPLLRLAVLAISAPRDIERLRDALRLSNGERDRLLAGHAVLAALRDPPGLHDLRRLLFDHGARAIADGLRIAQASRSGAPEPGWNAALDVLRGLEPPTFPFTGQDVMARGLRGVAVGTALTRLRTAFAQAGFPENAETRSRLLAQACSDPRDETGGPPRA